MFVLTAEKTPVINDLGPQYQDLHHMGKGRGAARALQLVPAFQMQLVRVANFYFFNRGNLMKCKCEGAENKQLLKVLKSALFFASEE